MFDSFKIWEVEFRISSLMKKCFRLDFRVHVALILEKRSLFLSLKPKVQDQVHKGFWISLCKRRKHAKIILVIWRSSAYDSTSRQCLFVNSAKSQMTRPHWSSLRCDFYKQNRKFTTLKIKRFRQRKTELKSLRDSWSSLPAVHVFEVLKKKTSQ